MDSVCKLNITSSILRYLPKTKLISDHLWDCRVEGSSRQTLTKT